MTIKSGIKELHLEIPLAIKENYSFPCSVLSDEAAASSIQSLCLWSCTFHPISTLGHLRRLKILNLSVVHITEEGLGHLLSKSSALERLEIRACNEIICLKIPFTLQNLKFLVVTNCMMLQVIEIDAPNLFSFTYDSTLIEICVRNSSQLKHVHLYSFCLPGILSSARARLPSIAQHVESLTLLGYGEVCFGFNIPMIK
jgi:hypothetical protein